MGDTVTIALDAMGGDNAPRIVVRGADIARERHPDARFLFFGDEARIAPLLARSPRLRDAAEVRHTDEMVASDDKPSQALRRGRRSSMRLAIDAVADGSAAGAVSAGNTGALMAMSKVVLKTLPGIDRPAIASFFPTQRGESVMLDLGANVECDANNLVQFAVMGAAFARTVLGVQTPTVGLLNVGEEDLKGNDTVKLAAQLLRDTSLPLAFEGFIEGDDIAGGTTDVIVTDGFTGNVALKTAEGTAKLYSTFLRRAFQKTLASRLGYLLAKGAMATLRERVDPRHYNGGVFLGLNVKSHGGTDGIGFGTAIGLAIDMAADNLTGRITQDFKRFGSFDEPQAQAAVS